MKHAEVAELVDAPDLGSGAARCESSSLSFRTIILSDERNEKPIFWWVFLCLQYNKYCSNKDFTTYKMIVSLWLLSRMILISFGFFFIY